MDLNKIILNERHPKILHTVYLSRELIINKNHTFKGITCKPIKPYKEEIKK